MSIFDLRRLPIAAALILSLVLLAGCGQDLPSQNFRLQTFGTYIDLEMIGVDRDTALAARDQLQLDFDHMYATWHPWEPGPVERINRFINEGRPLAAPPSVLPLIRISQDLAAKSDFLFDPGIGQLIKLWGFQSDPVLAHAPPDADAIAFWLDQHPSIRDITIEGFHLRSINTAVRLDFGGISRGYAVDHAIRRLQEMGIGNAIVNVGGNLRAIGSRATNPWRIAIHDAGGGGVSAIVSVTGNEAVFTSGDYQRNFTWEGKFYHHIIDPRTGHPASGTRAVTVLHPDATTADAAATALFVAGPEHWHRVAQQMGVKYVMLFDEAGRLHMNPAMQKRAELRQSVEEIIISAPL